MIRIGICDDVPFYADSLAKGITHWQKEQKIMTQILKFQSGEDLLFEIECSGHFSVIFLDIQLTGLSGIETALQIRKQYHLINIVFISLYNLCQEIHGQCWWPILYLEKPFNQEKLYHLLNHVHKEYQSINLPFQFQSNHWLHSVNLHEVLYFSSDVRVVKIILEDGSEHKMYHKLSDIEEKLQYPQNIFLRIHQSYLVSSRKIIKFHRRAVTLVGDIELPVSKSRKDAIIQFQMDAYAEKDGLRQ